MLILALLFNDVAPEILQESRLRGGHLLQTYGPVVSSYTCLCGFPPFSDELYSTNFPYTLSQQIKQGRFDYPSPCRTLLGTQRWTLSIACLLCCREKRYAIKQCINHPWMLDTSSLILEESSRSGEPEGVADVATLPIETKPSCVWEIGRRRAMLGVRVRALLRDRAGICVGTFLCLSRSSGLAKQYLF